MLGSNGCDSITTRVLIVETLHKDTICQVEFATYTWRGNTLPASTDSHGYYEFPGVKIINGTDVDTVSYLLLTVNPNPVVEVTSLTDLCPNVGYGALQANITTATKGDYRYVWTGDLTAIPVTVTTSALTTESVMSIPAAPASCGQTYHETVTVTDANGCTAAATATISVKSPATPTIEPNTGIHDDNLGCNPTTIVLTYNDFIVTDECNATAKAVVTPSSVAENGCGRTQTWTASYTNVCNVSATPVTITYTWTVDAQKPTITTTAVSGDKGCNPAATDIADPIFKVNDNCAGEFTLPSDSISDSGELTVGTCGRKHTWIAHYTDPCGNKAVNDTVEYVWTVDPEKPVINTTFASANLGCNPATIPTPTFTVSDNCAGNMDLPTDSITVTGPTSLGCTYTQSWRAHYSDPCGNKAKDTTITYTWTIDGTNPTFTVPKDTAVCRNIDNTYIITPNVTGDVTDAADGCSTPTVSYIDQEPETHADGSLTIVRKWTVTDACDNFTVKDQIITVNPRLTFSDEVEICDNELPYTFHGHLFMTGGTQTFIVPSVVTGCDSTSVLTVNVKAPLVVSTPLECPADLVFTLWYGRCDTVVTLTEMATMNPPVENTTIVNDLSLYNPLTEGTHHITWSLLDECGHVVESCTQNITVKRMPCDSARDFDGNVYPAAYIGCDCWTLINLKSEHYSDGTPIAEYTRYADSDSLENIYGKLYSWYSSARVPEGDDSAVPADSLWPYGTYVQGICPAGWALPTVQDYMDMYVASGGQAGLVKSPSTDVWLPGKQGIAPNLFNAYGAGYYEGGINRYFNLLGETHFWASDYSANSSTSNNFVLNYYCDSALFQENLKGLGYSIRCVKRIYILPE